MAQERSSQRLLRHACTTCGTNEIVVKVPAMKPSKVVRRIVMKRYQNEKEHAKLPACPVFLTPILKLHQKFMRLPRDGMLHFFQLIFDLVQAIHQLLKLLRHAAEQRSDFRILKVLKLRDDVVALLAGLYKVDQAFHTGAAQAIFVEALREHAGEEERVIADVFAHLALTIKGRSRPVDGIRFQQHLAYIAQRATICVFDFVESLCFTKFGEQVRDIVMHLRAAHANVTIISFNNFLEKLLQWIRFRYHLVTPFSLHCAVYAVTSSPLRQKTRKQIG